MDIWRSLLQIAFKTKQLNLGKWQKGIKRKGRREKRMKARDTKKRGKRRDEF